MMTGVSDNIASSFIESFTAGVGRKRKRIVEVFISHFMKLSRLNSDIGVSNRPFSHGSGIAP